MRRCLDLAKQSEYYVAPNPMVGAVLVAPDGTILGEGHHERYGYAHAEVNCFADAEQRGVSPEAIHEATLYVSLEPCSHYGKTPPCAELIQRKHPARVVCGMADPNPRVSGRGIRMVEEAGIEVVCGVLENECRALNKRFLCLQEKKRPYVILKWAQTADGFIDRRREEGDGQDVLVISNPLTKQLVHQMRAENMAILIGARTLRLDNPTLRTTRWQGRNPIRVVLDRHLRSSVNVALLTDSQQPSDYLPEVPRTIVYSENTEWEHVLADMAAKNIHSVMVEGGATILTMIIQSGIYDEVHIEVSSAQIGDGVPAPEYPLHSEPVGNIEGNLIFIEYKNA